MEWRRHDSFASGSWGAMWGREYWYHVSQTAVPCTLAGLDYQSICGFVHIVELLTDYSQSCVYDGNRCVRMSRFQLFSGF
jgi:hypothetical protein